MFIALELCDEDFYITFPDTVIPLYYDSTLPMTRMARPPLAPDFTITPPFES